MRGCGCDSCREDRGGTVEVNELGLLIVSIDPDGRNLFEENKVTFNEKKDKALEEIYPQVSFIK